MRSLLPRFPVIAAVIGVLMTGFGSGEALADDASRISRLESELQQLRMRIDEQNRRILQLEEQLRVRTDAPVIRTVPDKRDDRPAAAATDPLPWHSPESWDRVAEGMSEVQVVDILGEPTSVESYDRLKTLFYRRTIAGVGSVSGHVNLRDNRVLAINKPSFGR